MFIAPFEEFRKAHAAQYLNGEDLLHASLEAQETDGLPGFDVDHPDATGAFLGALDQRDATEDRTLAHLGQADESQGSDKIDAAREARQLRDGAPGAALEIDDCQTSFARFQQPEF